MKYLLLLLLLIVNCGPEETSLKCPDKEFITSFNNRYTDVKDCYCSSANLLVRQVSVLECNYKPENEPLLWVSEKYSTYFYIEEDVRLTFQGNTLIDAEGKVPSCVRRMYMKNFPVAEKFKGDGNMYCNTTLYCKCE